jgi:hypothetical protein
MPDSLPAKELPRARRSPASSGEGQAPRLEHDHKPRSRESALGWTPERLRP